jgi:hypothetical protein
MMTTALFDAGLSPEFVSFASGRLVKGTAASNVLRPEAVESIFMLWRITGDPMYRDWGWEIFKAFDEYSKARSQCLLDADIAIDASGRGALIVQS